MKHGFYSVESLSKSLVFFKTWLCRKMLRAPWTDSIVNVEVLCRTRNVFIIISREIQYLGLTYCSQLYKKMVSGKREVGRGDISW